MLILGRAALGYILCIYVILLKKNVTNWLSQVQPRLLGEQPKNLQGSRRLVIGPICKCDGVVFCFVFVFFFAFCR